MGRVAGEGDLLKILKWENCKIGKIVKMREETNNQCVTVQIKKGGGKIEKN